MAEDKVKAIIKTGSGTELIIESDRRTVQEIVSEIYRREESRIRFREEFEKRRKLERNRFEELQKTRNREAHGNTARKSANRSNTKTKVNIFMDLIKSNFFIKPKNISEVQEALQEKGYHYPSTSISPTLLRLVRKGSLSRIKQISNDKEMWVYSNGS
jgi:hypothetical protein